MSNADLAGHTFMITGANTGIGRATAIELARRGADVVLAGRSEERTRPVLDEIGAAGGKASFLQIDLADLASTARAAKSFLDSGRSLDVLVNNAGLVGARGLTKDGFELTFGTNHLGPFLLTVLLLPLLKGAKGARIVNVSSRGHDQAKGIDWGALRSPGTSAYCFKEYYVSKLCNVLFTKELARGKAGPGVHSYSLHPGSVASDIWRNVGWPFGPLIRFFSSTNEEGAKTSLYCATSPEVAEDNGLYYDDCRRKTPSKLAEDEALAKKLWQSSEEWVAPFMK